MALTLLIVKSMISKIRIIIIGHAGSSLLVPRQFPVLLLSHKEKVEYTPEGRCK
jgi:hypothetical protein